MVQVLIGFPLATTPYVLKIILAIIFYPSPILLVLQRVLYLHVLIQYACA